MTAARNAEPSLARRLAGHIAISRFDHWTKNVFVIPGIVVPLSIQAVDLDAAFWLRLTLAFLAIGMTASSNYVLNEILDAPKDRCHPLKKNRPVVTGLVHIGLGYVQWIVMGVIGIGLGWRVSKEFAFVLAALWTMGCLYNIPPVRLKDKPYADALSEAVNNPLRMLAGWYVVTNMMIPPASLLLSYWMVGAYFMALKRFSEYRQISKQIDPGTYRKSFHYCTEESLLVSVMFYAASAMLCLGAFIVRYRLELVLAFPLVAWVMAIYLKLAFEEDSPVQNPERLHKNVGLMIALTICTLSMIALLLYDIPALSELLEPTIPTGG